MDFLHEPLTTHPIPIPLAFAESYFSDESNMYALAVNGELRKYFPDDASLAFLDADSKPLPGDLALVHFKGERPAELYWTAQVITGWKARYSNNGGYAGEVNVHAHGDYETIYTFMKQDVTGFHKVIGYRDNSGLYHLMQPRIEQYTTAPESDE